MGNICSSPDQPLVRAFLLANSYGEKADIILKIAALNERGGKLHQAVIDYGTYIHCAAVHIYKEDAKKSRDLLLNKVNSARRIFQYRRVLESNIQQKCCSTRYVAPLINPPTQLAPWEWQEWLVMVSSPNASLDSLLERFGLVMMESQSSKDLALASAMASTVNVAPNINITGPTITNNPSISVNTGQTLAASGGADSATAAATTQLPQQQAQAPQHQYATGHPVQQLLPGMPYPPPTPQPVAPPAGYPQSAASPYAQPLPQGYPPPQYGASAGKPQY